jgi:hypothetical protein
VSAAPIVIQAETLTLVVQRETPEDIHKKSMELNVGGLVFPSYDTLFGRNQTTDFVNIKVSTKR